MTDVVAFMAWKRIVPWKVLSMKARPNELVPVGYGARYYAFRDSLERGSRIWVVTRIAGTFSLAACVTVRDVLDSEEVPRRQCTPGIDGLLDAWRFVAEADARKSEFFETNNADPVIESLGIEFAQSKSIVYCEESLADAFALCVRQGRESLFLSYTWDDSRRFALAVARGLRRESVSSWIDAWAMPRYEKPENEKRKKISDARLKDLIRLGVRRSKAAVVINSGDFGKGLWTKREIRFIREAGIPCFEVMRGGDRPRFDEPPIHARRVDEVVREVVRRYHAR